MQWVNGLSPTQALAEYYSLTIQQQVVPDGSSGETKGEGKVMAALPYMQMAQNMYLSPVTKVCGGPTSTLSVIV